jgi:hypothetical protein
MLIMSMSLSAVNDSINDYTKKIRERETFISNANKLISDASQSSKKLGEASDNLALGLTIGNQPADGGKLADMVTKINKNVGTLQGAVNLASAEIKIFGLKLSNLKAEKERIIQAARDASREKNEDVVVVRKTLKEELQ